MKLLDIKLISWLNFSIDLEFFFDKIYRLRIDYEETYYLVIDAIIFQYLISLAIFKVLEMHLIDMVVTSVYGILDIDVYEKIFAEFKLPKAKP